jgi:hypothetical protein
MGQAVPFYNSPLHFLVHVSRTRPVGRLKRGRTPDWSTSSGAARRPCCDMHRRSMRGGRSAGARVVKTSPWNASRCRGTVPKSSKCLADVQLRITTNDLSSTCAIRPRRTLIARTVSVVMIALGVVACSGQRISTPAPTSRGSTLSAPQIMPTDAAIAACAPGEVATRIAGCARVVQLALGERHSCALMASGRVMCWGDNAFGQLGDATGRPSVVPVLVQRLEDAIEIAAGRATTCARTRRGRVLCWVMNEVGQANPDASRVKPPFALPAVSGGKVTQPPGYDLENVRPWPSPVSDVEDAAGIAMGIDYACALRASGTIACWGNNHAGQLGAVSPAAAFQRNAIAVVPRPIEIAAAGLQSVCVPMRARSGVGADTTTTASSEHSKRGRRLDAYRESSEPSRSNSIQRACARG